eukprot:8467017-Karenia_brevis.AAC.1
MGLNKITFRAAIIACRRVQRVVFNVISFSGAIPASKQGQGVRLVLIAFIVAIFASRRAAIRVVTWQCGLQGVRVGEASHPGPSEMQMAADTMVDDSDASEVPMSPWKMHRFEDFGKTEEDDSLADLI